MCGQKKRGGGVSWGLIIGCICTGECHNIFYIKMVENVLCCVEVMPNAVLEDMKGWMTAPVAFTHATACLLPPSFN